MKESFRPDERDVRWDFAFILSHPKQDTKTVSADSAAWLVKFQPTLRIILLVEYPQFFFKHVLHFKKTCAAASRSSSLRLKLRHGFNTVFNGLPDIFARYTAAKANFARAHESVQVNQLTPLNVNKNQSFKGTSIANPKYISDDSRVVFSKPW